MEGIFPFARSLPLDKVLHPDTLIAYEYNGEPISYAHGYNAVTTIHVKIE